MPEIPEQTSNSIETSASTLLPDYLKEVSGRDSGLLLNRPGNDSENRRTQPQDGSVQRAARDLNAGVLQLPDIHIGGRLPGDGTRGGELPGDGRARGDRPILNALFNALQSSAQGRALLQQGAAALQEGLNSWQAGSDTIARGQGGPSAPQAETGAWQHGAAAFQEGAGPLQNGAALLSQTIGALGQLREQGGSLSIPLPGGIRGKITFPGSSDSGRIYPPADYKINPGTAPVNPFNPTRTIPTPAPWTLPQAGENSPARGTQPATPLQNPWTLETDNTARPSPGTVPNPWQLPPDVTAKPTVQPLPSPTPWHLPVDVSPKPQPTPNPFPWRLPVDLTPKPSSQPGDYPPPFVPPTPGHDTPPKPADQPPHLVPRPDGSFEITPQDFDKIGPKAAQVLKDAGVTKLTVRPAADGTTHYEADFRAPLEIPQDPAVSDGVRELKLASHFEADVKRNDDGSFTVDNIQGLNAESKILFRYQEVEVNRIQLKETPEGQSEITSSGSFHGISGTKTKVEPGEIFDKAKTLFDRMQQLTHSN